MQELNTSCSRCGRLLLDDARFCGSCGALSPEHLRERLAERKSSLHSTKMATRSLAIAFTGTIAALFLHGIFFSANAAVTATEMVVGILLEILVGAAAALPIGMATMTSVLQRGATGKDFAWAIPAALLSLAAGSLWIHLLHRIVASDGVEASVNLWLMMQIVLIAPLAEEWLCRGIMWEAMRKISTERTTIFATALLFAFLHFLNGGNYLELPHRFVAGFLFGVLRAKSGSIWPGVVAHFLVNVMAVSLG